MFPFPCPVKWVAVTAVFCVSPLMDGVRFLSGAGVTSRSFHTPYGLSPGYPKHAPSLICCYWNRWSLLLLECFPFILTVVIKRCPLSEQKWQVFLQTFAEERSLPDACLEDLYKPNNKVQFSLYVLFPLNFSGFLIFSDKDGYQAASNVCCYFA